MTIPMLAHRVLVVEDEELLLMSYCESLAAAGYSVRGARSGEAALEALPDFQPALVLLDLTLAGELDGFQVLKTIRSQQAQVRIVIVTARSADESQLQGLALGADDYVIKLASREILIARVNAQMRRVIGPPARLVVFGAVMVDLGRRVVRRDRKEIALGGLEMQLLERLLASPGQYVPFADLLAQVWGQKLTIGPRFMPEDLAPIKGVHYRLCQKLGTGIVHWKNARGLCLEPPDGQVESVARAEVVERIGRGRHRSRRLVHASH